MMKLKVLELVIFHKAKSLSLAYSKVIKWVTFILSVKYIRNSHMYGEIKKKMDFKKISDMKIMKFSESDIDKLFYNQLYLHNRTNKRFVLG